MEGTGEELLHEEAEKNKTAQHMPPPLSNHADERSIARRRWKVATQEDALVLLNPPEERRTYSDSDGHRQDGDALSVLGSLGEWKVVSTDRSRWLSMDFGSVRRVHSLVLQCGALDRSFSGWVTRLKVACSTEDTAAEAWVELGEMATGCGSKPMREHRVKLRTPVWARHVKLTPTEWKVAAVLSTGEVLTPFISLRAAVLVTHER